MYLTNYWSSFCVSNGQAEGTKEMIQGMAQARKKVWEKDMSKGNLKKREIK